MKFFSIIRAALKSYDYRDKLISLFAVALFFLMMAKLMVFPYGLFGFGESNVYTEGIVSKYGITLINPLFVDYNEADREVSRLVFSGLMKYDPEKRAVVDDMAQLTINEDKTKYTLVLREGLKWHDGKPVTADDVYFTFHDLIQAPSFSNEILRTNFAGVQIEKEDSRTISFTLEKANIFFIANLTAGIVPKHILEDTEPFDLLTSSFNKLPVGTGPYVVTDPVQTFPDGRTQVTLERNPYYYGMPSEIEYVRFISYPTTEELINEMDAVNGIVKITGDFLSEFKASERFSLIPYELPQYVGVFMNMESEFLKDKNVRLALQKALDKKALIEQFVDKIPVDTPLMELNQEDWVYQPSKEQAQGALKEAGYEYADEDTEKAGWRYNEEGEALSLNLIARSYNENTPQFEETKKIVGFLQSAWEDVGFDIQVEFLPEDVFNEGIRSRQYDLLLVGQTLGYNLDTYSYWHSTQAGPMGQNFSNYKSFQVDKLIEDVRFVFNQEKRERELKELAEKIKEDIPAIFLFRPVYYYANDGKVSGILMNGLVFPSDRFENLDQWKFER